jgi:hypothetical protein
MNKNKVNDNSQFTNKLCLFIFLTSDNDEKKICSELSILRIELISTLINSRKARMICVCIILRKILIIKKLKEKNETET